MLAAALRGSRALPGSTPLLAETTVRMLHVEQNPQISGFWNDIARRYEAANPGVKVEVQYLENEAYKKKLTTLLQSSGSAEHHLQLGRRRAARAGQGGRDRGPDAASWIGAWKERFVPAAVQAYTIDGKVYGVPMHTSRSASSTTRISSPRPASTRPRSRPGTTCSGR